MTIPRAALPRKLSSREKTCLLLVLFLSLMHSVSANRIKAGKTDELIEEGHLIPGGFSSRHRLNGSRKVPFWWPSAFSVSTQALLRHLNIPIDFHAQSPAIPADSSRATKRASHHPVSEKEHSNPQIPTTGVRAPRGAHEYDVPQIECPNAEDGMERFACPTPDALGRYRCIDDHVLCDGFLDCPDGSDEDRHSCMFYKATKAHLDVLADALLRWARGRYNK